MDRRVRYRYSARTRPQALNTRRTRPPLDRRLAVLMLSFLTGFVSATAGLERSVLVSEGVEREYLLFTPSRPVDPAPLLVVLHGRGGSGQAMAGMTGLNELAERDGAFVVYPEGLERQWNYLTGIGGNTGTNDVRFLEDLVEILAARFPVDRSRIAVAGFSNGGFMAQRLACEPSTPFTAFAAVAAAAFGGMPGICSSAGPRSVLLIHGTDDGVVPWRGSSTMLQGRVIMLSAPLPETFAFWADLAGCREVVRREVDGTNEHAVRMLSAVSCREERSVAFYVLQGGGHHWPGAHTDSEGIDAEGDDGAGSSLGFDASVAVWDFVNGLRFSSHP